MSGTKVITKKDTLEDLVGTLSELVDVVHTGFKRVDERFKGIDERLDGLTDQVGMLTERFDELNGRLNVIGVDVHETKDRMFAVERRLGRVETRVEDLNDFLLDLFQVPDDWEEFFTDD